MGKIFKRIKTVEDKTKKTLKPTLKDSKMPQKNNVPVIGGKRDKILKIHFNKIIYVDHIEKLH